MISVFGSLVGKEEIENVSKCMESQWMGFGKNVDLFEKKYSEKYNISNFAMVDSGSNALFMAVKLLNLPQGSEIILPSFTWVSCAQAVLMSGLVPVFCDVDLKTMNVRVEDVKEKISPLTSAIMIVHYAGLPVDIEPIINLGYPVIEDAAHAIASTYNGQACGTFGDVGIFSFDAVKNLTVGEGGGITTREKSLIERAKVMRYCGIGKSGFDSAISNSDKKSRWWEYNIQEPFIKMLPTNLAASIGIAQLDRIDFLQQRRKSIWDKYQIAFKDINEIIRPVNPNENQVHSYFTYTICIPQRDELAHYLLEKKIYTTLRYHPLHMNPLYNQLDHKLTNTEILNETALSIPLHPRLTDSEVDYIIEEIENFFYKS